MAFIRKSGKTKLMYFPKTASTAYTEGSLVTLSAATGYITEATSSTTKILGVIRRTVTSASTDYALNSLVPVEVPIEKFVVWEALCGATAVYTDVGKTCDITDALTVNRGADTHHAVTVVELISTTKVGVMITAGYDYTVGA